MIKLAYLEDRFKVNFNKTGDKHLYLQVNIKNQ